MWYRPVVIVTAGRVTSVASAFVVMLTFFPFVSKTDYLSIGHPRSCDAGPDCSEDELQRVLRASGGWCTALLRRCPIPTRSRTRQSVRRSTAQRHATHQERCRGVGKGGVEDRRAHSRRRLVRTEHKKATKRRVTHAGRNLMHGLLAPGVQPRKRIKRAPSKKGVTSATRRRRRQMSTKREADIFDNDGFRT